MKKKILVALSLAAILASSIPSPDAQAAWKITEQGRQYTTNTTQGYATGWKKLGKFWYYFDQKGIMKTGWVLSQNQWYYLKSNGRMAVNCWMGSFYLGKDGAMVKNTSIGGIQVGADGTKVTSDNPQDSSDSEEKRTGWYQSTENKKWFYYKDDGELVKGWLTLPNGKYYMNLSTGAMTTGFKNISRQRYYFNSSTGTVRTGWFKVKGKRYYASASGIVRRNRWLRRSTMYMDKYGAASTGFKVIGGNTYYFSPTTAKKLTGWQVIEGKWYYFDNTGVMTVKKWVRYPSTGKKCYLTADGSMAYNTWAGKYFVGSNGYRTGVTRSKGLFTENGRIYFNNSKYNKVTGWRTINGKSYFFDTDYAAATGLKTLNGKSYYFDSNGVMQTGLITIGSDTYYFNANGEMLVNGSVNLGGINHTFGPSGSYVKPQQPQNTTKGSQIASYALKFLGRPYVWGGTSLTNGADCSGFTMSVMANFGIKIPRVAEDQATGSSMWGGGPYTKGKKVVPTLTNLLPGDLVFYYSPIGHVGIYIGNGKIVHASSSTTGIIVSNFNYSIPVAAMRYWS